MSFSQQLDCAVRALDRAGSHEADMLTRLKAELAFAHILVDLHPEQREAWEGLVREAAATAQQAIAGGCSPAQAVAAAEALLAPMTEVAKSYTIHCTGHAHIDMNWMWNWPETVATVNDTFTTVDRLMDEFPNFIFSQSQASIYQILKDYLPELYARVKQRVREGRWEITASQWVEGDKNLASGEIIFRHLLYTRRFLQEEFGLPYDAVQIDFEPDTFGHANTVPALLDKGGVRYYYLHRAHQGPEMLFWWQGTDGSRVLVFDDKTRGYNGQINGHIINGMRDFCRQTGLKDYLFVYGVGDHGGGPTRRDLTMAMTMQDWPSFPRIAFSSYAAFYGIAAQASNLPVIEGELNYVFEGCYTAQSNIKRANRRSENALVEAEMCALLGKGLTGMAYPADDLYIGWRHTMFNQFHDILPGSGIHATYEHAQGIFQETMARTTMVKTRALRAIAAQVNTAACCCCTCGDDAGCATCNDDTVTVGPGIGGGPGDNRAFGSLPQVESAVSRRGAGGVCCDPFVVFNPNPWPRSEVVVVPLWDRDWADGQIMVKDDAGNTYPAQVVGREPGWGHTRTDIAFPVTDIPGLGYRSFSVARSVEPGTATGCTTDGKGLLENEYYRVQVDPNTGGIVHLIDKASGRDLVPAGQAMNVLEYELEGPHPMTAWVLGQIVKRVQLANGASDCPHQGPFMVSMRTNLQFGESKFTQRITLYAGSPRIDITLEADWLERGSPEMGVPTLRVSFPSALANPVATYETPNGSVTRATDTGDYWSQSDVYFRAGYGSANQKVELNSGEVPSQKWSDLSGDIEGQPAGITLLNDSKYGFQAHGSTLRMTLIRSSYDPDPLPELGKQIIRYALQPHLGTLSIADATRAGYAFNLPLNLVSTTEQRGTLPASAGFADILTRNVMISAIKLAEDSEAIIVRLYEMEGQAGPAQVHLADALAAPDAPAVATDAMEMPLSQNTAHMAEGILTVEMPAYGQVTVKVG